MRLLQFLLLAIILSLSNSGAVTAACNISNIDNLQIDTDKWLDVSFRETGHLIEIKLEQFTEIDKAAKIAAFRTSMAGQLPSDRCGTSVTMGSTRASIDGPNWLLTTGVKTHVYWCLKMTGICCRGIECRSCEWIWSDENIGLRKTLDTYTRFVPRAEHSRDAAGLYKADIVVKAVPTMEDLEQWEKDLLNFLRNILGVVKFTSFGLIDLADHFELSLPKTPMFELLREKFPSMPNFRPVVSDVRFEEGDHGFGMMVVASDERKCSVAEEIGIYFASFKQIRQQHESMETSRTIIKGENLWSIAEEIYGDGRFFLPLAQYNGLKIAAPLREGKVILIPSLRRMEQSAAKVVSRGQSLWSISNNQSESYEKLRDQMLKEGRNPDLIYPAELVR